MLKAGKKTKAWNRERAKLKRIYLDKGIVTCELRFHGCWNDNALSFAHRYKRGEGAEHTFEGTILCCVSCHQKIEFDRELTKEVFERLR